LNPLLVGIRWGFNGLFIAGQSIDDFVGFVSMPTFYGRHRHLATKNPQPEQYRGQRYAGKLGKEGKSLVNCYW
jgi:hypothetical protein